MTTTAQPPRPPRPARPPRRTALTITLWVTLGLIAALVLLIVRPPKHSHTARPVGAVGSSTVRPVPRSSASTSTTPPTPDIQSAIDDAYALAHREGYRLGIAVTDLRSGRAWHAADAGTFGTGSVIKALIAAKMLLIGAMTGDDAIEARHMIMYSDDQDGTDLWTRFGADQIITWLSDHYATHFGDPNKRPYFWGNTQVTAQSLVAFYYAARHDRAVWPWLSDAMAHTQEIATDGTDEYFGIPRAGGGHTVKQSWGIKSSGDGYADDATVNSTGIVTVGTHQYAVVILTEGHGNDDQADTHGLVHAQADMITAVARLVLAGLPSGH